ncbi:MAG TPA: hypothetical protein VFH51_14760 [Myxococcota bacterium]|nr:hypothetical protein [Myxococcota bacterium]
MNAHQRYPQCPCGHPAEHTCCRCYRGLCGLFTCDQAVRDLGAEGAMYLLCIACSDARFEASPGLTAPELARLELHLAWPRHRDRDRDALRGEGRLPQGMPN